MRTCPQKASGTEEIRPGASGTIREQRTRTRLVLKDNPSLTPYVPEAIAIGYQLAQDLAVRETGMDYDTFPSESPYTIEQILEETFLPD